MSLASSPSALRHIHQHTDAARCPVCEQEIPNDKYEEVTARMEQREQAALATATGRLNAEFAEREAQAAAAARAELQKVANDNAAQVERLKTDAAAREEEVRVQAKAEADAAVKARIEEAEQRKAEAEAARSVATSELEAARRDHQAKLASLAQEAEAHIATVRDEAVKNTQAHYQDKIAEAVRLREEAEKQATETATALTQKLNESAAIIGQLQAETPAREAAARAAGKAETELAMQAALSLSDTAKTAAEGKLAALETEQATRLEEQRLALEAASSIALNAEKAKAYEEKLKLETRLQEITRELQKKTAEELGEGAEVQLFEELTAKFPEDRLTRVQKGAAGADIIHEVMNNGKLCGKIIYDAKNRNAWRSEYVSKLRKDQVAGEADHAVLSTLAFPKNCRQVHIEDSVIIANPARVAIIAEILRLQIIRSSKLRQSNEDKAEKTAAVYEFITSELCGQLLDQVEARSNDLLDLDVKEKKAHDSIWKRRGELVRGVQKANADLVAQLDHLTGSGENGE